MATLDFPSASPGATYTGGNGVTYTYDGAAGVWTAAGGGGSAGKVLQVVQGTTNTSVSTASGIVDTGLSASITPTSASSKILVTVQQNGCRKNTTQVNTLIAVYLMRGATQIAALGGGLQGATFQLSGQTIGTSYLDAPATTSSVTYKTTFEPVGFPDTVSLQNNFALSTITLMEIAA